MAFTHESNSSRHPLHFIPPTESKPRKQWRWWFILLVIVGVILIGVLVWVPKTPFLFSAGAPPPVTVIMLDLHSPEAQLVVARTHYDSDSSLRSLLAYGQTLDTTIATLKAAYMRLQIKFYRQLAMDAGQRYGIRWTILLGLWMQESGVNSNARGDGKKGKNGKMIPGTEHAFGQGQIHLPTAQTHYAKDMTKERLMDPIENGFASAKILHDYTVMMGGNIRYGISAYQQGPGATRSQFQQHRLPNNMAYVLGVMQFALEVE